MRPKEISVGLSGVISTASWENLRPSFTVTAELEENETMEECFSKLRETLRAQFELESNRARIDLIEKQYGNIRFREKNGKKYPSVTSITDWDKDWRITDDELRQYAARGNVVHKLIEGYIETKRWLQPEAISELKEDLIILATGSLKLNWEDCSHQAFFKQFEKDFEWLEGEQEVYNDEHLYSGQYDQLAKYKGRLAIIDFKSGSSYSHKQTSAYAVCKEKIELLIICPVGPTTNKVGYKKPDITEDIKGNFKAFLKDRSRFHQRFGI